MIEHMLSNTFYYQEQKLLDSMVTLRVNEIVNGMFNVITEKNLIKVGALLTFTILTRMFISTNNKTIKLMDRFVLVGLFYLIMVSQLFPWTTFPFSKLDFIQFSWRLYGFVSILFAFAGGYYVSKLLKTKLQKIIGIATLILIQLAIFNSESIYYRMQICNSQEPELKLNTGYLGLIGGEYLPSRLPRNKEINMDVFNDFIHRRGQVIIPNNETTLISNFAKEKGYITFDAQVETQDNLELPLTYYIGYKATLDNEEIEYQQSNFGLIELPIQKSGKVEIRYVGTTLQHISMWITMVSLFLFTIFVVRENRKIKQKK